MVNRFTVTRSIATSVPPTSFQSTVDGFSTQVPSGLVADIVSFEPLSPDESPEEIGEMEDAAEEAFGYNVVAVLCPEIKALSEIGGGHKSGGETRISIMKYSNLQDKPEFAAVADSGITTSDFLAFEFQREQDDPLQSSVNPHRDFKIVSQIDKTVNLIDVGTNQPPIWIDIPTKLVEYTYSDRITAQNRIAGGNAALSLFMVLNDETTGGRTGYEVEFNETTDIMPPGLAITIPQIKQIYDWFELVTPTAESSDVAVP